MDDPRQQDSELTDRRQQDSELTEVRGELVEYSTLYLAIGQYKRGGAWHSPGVIGRTAASVVEQIDGYGFEKVKLVKVTIPLEDSDNTARPHPSHD